MSQNGRALLGPAEQYGQAVPGLEHTVTMDVGVELNAQLPWRGRSVRVMNFNSQWLHLIDGKEFIPPKSIWVIVNLPLVDVLRAVWEAPPGVTQPAVNAGSVAMFRVYDYWIQQPGTAGSGGSVFALPSDQPTPVQLHVGGSPLGRQTNFGVTNLAADPLGGAPLAGRSGVRIINPITAAAEVYAKLNDAAVTAGPPANGGHQGTRIDPGGERSWGVTADVVIFTIALVAGPTVIQVEEA